MNEETRVAAVRRPACLKSSQPPNSWDAMPPLWLGSEPPRGGHPPISTEALPPRLAVSEARGVGGGAQVRGVDDVSRHRTSAGLPVNGANGGEETGGGTVQKGCTCTSNTRLEAVRQPENKERSGRTVPRALALPVAGTGAHDVRV